VLGHDPALSTGVEIAVTPFDRLQADCTKHAIRLNPFDHAVRAIYDKKWVFSEPTRGVAAHADAFPLPHADRLEPAASAVRDLERARNPKRFGASFFIADDPPALTELRG